MLSWAWPAFVEKYRVIIITHAMFGFYTNICGHWSSESTLAEVAVDPGTLWATAPRRHCHCSRIRSLNTECVGLAWECQWILVALSGGRVINLTHSAWICLFVAGFVKGKGLPFRNESVGYWMMIRERINRGISKATEYISVLFYDDGKTCKAILILVDIDRDSNDNRGVWSSNLGDEFWG